MEVRIREIDPDNKEDVAAAARLHLELLNFGPMARLGELFLRKFCYTVLIEDGLMKTALYEVDGKPAGFIVYTDRSISFHRSAIRDHWVYVSYVLGLSILKDPRVFFRLTRALRVMFSRREEKELIGEDPMAEVIAIAVRPEYRTPKFLKQTQRRIAEELVEYAASRFRAGGLGRMRMIVDADNKAPLFLYHSLGAKLEPYEQGGKQSVIVWFDLEKQLQPPDA